MKIIKNSTNMKLLTTDNCVEIKKLFNKLREQINCSYLTYMKEDNELKIYFTSHQEWSNLLVREKLINHCPIYRNAFRALKHSSYIFTAWDFVQHKKGIEKEINDERTSLDIAHGLGLAMQKNNTRESIVFAGYEKDLYFHERASNKIVINESLAVFRREIDNLSL